MQTKVSVSPSSNARSHRHLRVPGRAQSKTRKNSGRRDMGRECSFYDADSRNVRESRFLAGCHVAWVVCSPSRGATPSLISIVLTADTEGHIGPCRDCPQHPALGGLLRRATALAHLRKKQPGLFLSDAGNALFGPESPDSHGKVMVAAYNALGYDAVNLCHR